MSGHGTAKPHQQKLSIAHLQAASLALMRLDAACRDRLKEVQGMKKKSKAGQQRAEDRAEQARTLPHGTRPQGMQNRQKAPDTAGSPQDDKLSP